MTSPASQGTTGELAEPCPGCGATVGECSCVRLRDSLHGRAAALQRAGMAAARAGDLHRSRTLLQRAAQLAAPGVEASRVLALVALCLGEAGLAAAAWRRAGAKEPGLLEDGPVRAALHGYNEALREAQAGDTAGALTRVDQVLHSLPDLVPAHRLRALLLAARGDASEARAACQSGLSVCRDDPLLLRCLATVPAVQAATAIPEAPAVPAARRRRAGRHAALGAAWAATLVLAVLVTSARRDGEPRVEQPPLASRLAPSPSPSPAPAPAAGAAPRGPSAATFDFAAYRRGRDAYARSDWPQAVSELAGAAGAPTAAYYRDDALYLLARAHARAARRDDARRTASLLLRDHPASIFANRITRQLAEQGAE